MTFESSRVSSLLDVLLLDCAVVAVQRTSDVQRTIELSHQIVDNLLVCIQLKEVPPIIAGCPATIAVCQ